jgi:phosphohistidine phosphatase
MKRTLLILRHAKSDRDAADVPNDYARPLARRGVRDATRMGRWLRGQDLMPGRVLSSPARRARQTVELAAESGGWSATAIRFDPRLYLASCETLCRRLSACPPLIRTLLLVGHNPGLDDLLEYLSADPPPRTASGKLLTAGAVAQLTLHDGWKGLEPRGATLVQLVRPRELE